jgi:hypothetical protein
MSGKGKDPTIKERLVCVETKLDTVIENLKNHLQHHWVATAALLTALITESVGLIFLIIKAKIL